MIADMPRGGREPRSTTRSVPVLWSTPALKGLWECVGQRRVRALAADPQGPAHLQHRRGGRVRPQRPAADRARTCSGTCCRSAFREQGLADPARRAMTVLVDAGRRGEPGPAPARVPRPAAPAADRPRLPVRRPRPQRARGRRADGARLRHRRAAVARSAPRSSRRATACTPTTRCATTSGASLVTSLPPGGHLRDGRRRAEVGERLRQRRRPAAAGPRGGRAARRGRVGHADAAARQHERAR